MSYRLEIQAKVRRLGRNPSISDRQVIETEHNFLTALLPQLKHTQQAAGVVDIISSVNVPNDTLTIWDEIVNESVPSGSTLREPPLASAPALAADHQLNTGAMNIEEQIIPLPSNGNVSDSYRDLELSHRIVHADHHLTRIRDLIAEKSFQYSHVIRVAPRKGVNIHSRAAVKKLNFQISVHCRQYSQCRTRLLRLGADPATQSRLRVLTPDDVKASTAIVNPNEPGSTRLKLSWIWQTAGGHRLGLSMGQSHCAGAGLDAGPDSGSNMFECE